MQPKRPEDPAVAKTKKKIVEELEQNGPLEGSELSRRLGAPEETVSRSIWDLIDSGCIELDWDSQFDLVMSDPPAKTA